MVNFYGVFSLLFWSLTDVVTMNNHLSLCMCVSNLVHTGVRYIQADTDNCLLCDDRRRHVHIVDSEGCTSLQIDQHYTL